MLYSSYTSKFIHTPFSLLFLFLLFFRKNTLFSPLNLPLGPLWSLISKKFQSGPLIVQKGPRLSFPSGPLVKVNGRAYVAYICGIARVYIFVQVN